MRINHLAIAPFLSAALAAGGGTVSSAPQVYTSGQGVSKAGGQILKTLAFKSASYEYTGLGASECTIDIEDDGTLRYTPAYTHGDVGYVTSKDDGKTWTFTAPAPKQPRTQPAFSIHDGRYFYWSSASPGLQFSYSDDKGKTWKLLSPHLQDDIYDWAKIISGKPVTSQLKNGTSKILYLSAPSLISVSVLPGTPFGPIEQRVMKSLDKGETWIKTKGQPTLDATKSGGPCEKFTKNGKSDEYLIWSNGLVTSNGTIMFGVRRCRSLSIAISDDEGDTWRWSEVPGSELVPYTIGLGTWAMNGNVLTPEAITQSPATGNLFALWVSSNYTLYLSKSTDNAHTWSRPNVVSAVNTASPNQAMNAYHPLIIHHPTEPNRAALAYYGSPNDGATWNAYIAETEDIEADFPVFTSIVVNEPSQPMQANSNKKWDQGYLMPFWDLIEFVGLRYHPKTGDLVGAFARKMCKEPYVDVQSFNKSSCLPGWDFMAMDKSPWQGYVATVKHA